ncbi:MAG: sulfite exporter TauE/SafE family protein [alpha proteobacterium HIMB59]|nr:MAG: sulfite exporter TauE/SafE family protein [alpha proteobacterium HIMB59]|tara:strand:- start:5378 stop:6280 length:903 start_codon:yes stop_codon:yes gene_type:complete
MNFYLPIAEISINIYLLISLGIGIGFISGLFGIGGGFITSPLLILVGIPPAVAVGTTTVQVFASTSTGVMSHFQKKNIDYQISFTMIVGGIFGTLTGVLLLSSLKNIGLIDNYLNAIYIILLLGTAMFILYETAKINLIYKNKKFKLHQHSWIHGLPIKIKYRKSKLYISILAPLSIGYLIGMLTGLTGIGGGFILIPCMIYILGMKTISVIGSSLLNITVVALISLFLQIYINQNIDFVLAIFLIISSSIGAAIASRIIDKFDQENLKVLFGVLLVIIASFLIYDLFRTPLELFRINYV